MIKTNQMQQNSLDVNNNSIPSLSDLGMINMDISDVPRLLEYYVLETDSTDKASVEKDLNASLADITSKSKHYETLITTNKERQAFNTFLTDWNTYVNEIPGILADGKMNNIGSAVQKINTSYTVWNTANNDLDAVTAINLNGADVVAQNTTNTAHSVLITNIILSIIAAIIGGILAFLLSSNILKSLRLLKDASVKIAEGDLSDQITVKSDDELGELAAAFNKMVNDLRAIVAEVSETANNLGANSQELSAAAQEATAASEQVSNTVNQLAVDATNQANSVQETSNIIEQLSSAANNVSAYTENVNQSSQKAAAASRTGVKQADNAVIKIEKIKEVTSEIAKVVALLGEKSNEIGKIVDVIKGIADQTNLLALNAAIEAARAGEQGRGFAVVAEEVRKLAEQSSVSAGQIESLIGNIQRETERAVQIMDVEQVEVSEGVEAVNSAGAAFQTIVEEINTVVEQVRQAFGAILQMSEGTSHAVKSVEEIGLIAEQNAASAQEMSAASEEQTATMVSVSKSAEELAKFGESLLRLVEKFKV
jgi:methyl-accepting chemotaxis protein